MKKKLILIFTIVISLLFINTLNALTPQEFHNMSEEKRQEALNGMDGKSRLEFLSEYETYKKEVEEYQNSSNTLGENRTGFGGNNRGDFNESGDRTGGFGGNDRGDFNESGDRGGFGGSNDNNQNSNTSSGSNNSSKGSNSGSSGASLNRWCSKFNSVWFILGRILQVIYVATPLLLIVTGAITFLRAMTNKDSGAVKKAEQTLIKKIIAAVLIFLLLPITKLSLKLVADEGWYDCAKCVFSPDESCKSGDVTTG